jgi:hypothetical protein
MSLTNRSPESLWKLGSRLPVDSLIAQAHVTLKKVAEDQLVSKRLGASFLAEVRAAVARLESLAGERSTADVASKSGTSAQNAALAAAMAWRTEFINLAANARDVDPMVPVEGTRVARELSPAAVANDVRRLVNLASKVPPAVAAAGVTPELLKRGLEAADALLRADAEQEYLHHEARSAAVRRMWTAAAEVLLAVRRINREARGAYARVDPSKARMYTMDILHRGKAPQAESPPPGMEAPAA